MHTLQWLLRRLFDACEAANLSSIDDWEAANREEEQAMCTCLSRETILSLRIAGGLRYIKTSLITIDTSLHSAIKLPFDSILLIAIAVKMIILSLSHKF